MARVGHSAMSADELTENIEAAVKAVTDKIQMVSMAGRVLLLLDGIRVYNNKWHRFWNLCKSFLIFCFMLLCRLQVRLNPVRMSTSAKKSNFFHH